MRKIEQQIVDAYNNGRHFVGGNTEVLPNGDVNLHGNNIVRGREVNTATLARWPTSATCSRLRALGFHVNVVKGVPYLDGKAV